MKLSNFKMTNMNEGKATILNDDLVETQLLDLGLNVDDNSEELSVEFEVMGNSVISLYVVGKEKWETSSRGVRYNATPILDLDVDLIDLPTFWDNVSVLQNEIIAMEETYS